MRNILAADIERPGDRIGESEDSGVGLLVGGRGRGGLLRGVEVDPAGGDGQFALQTRGLLRGFLPLLAVLLAGNDKLAVLGELDNRSDGRRSFVGLGNLPLADDQLLVIDLVVSAGTGATPASAAMRCRMRALIGARSSMRSRSGGTRIWITLSR